MYEEIQKAITKVSGEINNTLDVPDNVDFGDYSSNVAMQLFSIAKNTDYKSPRELADKLVSKLKDDNKLMSIVERVEVAGPGFINFFLKKDVLTDTLLSISSQKFIYRYSSKNKGKKVVVEYSSPNIAKPFTVGHLRSTIIGDAVANLLETTGWKVYRDNHLGDWGTQFGKQIYAIKTWGNLDEIEKSENPVKELVSLYVKFHEEAEKNPEIEEKAREWFKKLEDGDSEARYLWQRCVDLSWKEFEKIYGKLGVKFSHDFQNGRGLGEAFFENKMKPIIDELEKEHLLKEGKEGAKLVFFEDEKYPPAMIIKKDGATLYHTRDLATDKYRKDNYNPDLIVNEVGTEQTLYFQQLYEIEKLLGWFKDGQRVHIAHGLYRFKDKKMSTRKGDVIWLEDVLTNAVVMAYKKRMESQVTGQHVPGSEMLEIDKTVAIGALKYNDLKRDPKGDILFDWEEILNMEGNSGPYLQYTFARTQSVLAKAPNSKLQIASDTKINKDEENLLRMFIHYPEVVLNSAENYSPNMLCNYLYSLAQKYNTFYNSSKIIGGENEELRLNITEAAGVILENGLNLLGIEAPDKM